jgi:hypothetical protein
MLSVNGVNVLEVIKTVVPDAQVDEWHFDDKGLRVAIRTQQRYGDDNPVPKIEEALKTAGITAPISVAVRHTIYTPPGLGNRG